MTGMTDYAEIANSIASTIAKCSEPLSESQRLVLAGSVAVWMGKVASSGLGKEDIAYLIQRLERMLELLSAGELHMVAAKLIADISALKGRL